MPQRQRVTNSVAGFTLVEVLAVVVIMGIAAAIVVPQMLAAGTMGVQAAARMVISDLLYAQNEAIAQQAARRVVFDVANNSYRITDASDTTLSVSWKNGSAENYIVDFANDSRFSGVTLQSADFGGTATIEFDDLGGPNSGGTIELVFKNIRYRVTVAAFTGRVTVAKLSGG
jgi:prepilin-type N-terminal cleavage/methylation domain-containing protein